MSAQPTRCPWALSGNDLYVAYHDNEWGVPVHDDRVQFEFLILEGAQAGLSWSTILNKREGYREAFAGFDAERIARFGKRDVARLMKNPGIVRNRLKIEAAIQNARATLSVIAEEGSLSTFLWSFVNHVPRQNAWTALTELPARTEQSDRMSRELKARGFKFVGSTICYSLMQSVGMVNDHLVGCYRYAKVKALAEPDRTRRR